MPPPQAIIEVATVVPSTLLDGTFRLSIANTTTRPIPYVSFAAKECGFSRRVGFGWQRVRVAARMAMA